MITIIVSSCPTQLRGWLSRYLLELAPGIFVGTVSTRVREKMWYRICRELASGSAIMTMPARDREQRFRVLSHNPQWDIIEHEGHTIVRRPVAPSHRYATDN